MTSDLFDSVPDTRPVREDMAEGAVLLRGFAQPVEAELIAGIVRRDLPFYDASIAAASITAVNCFAREMGVLADDIPYDQVVATQFRNFW